VNHVEDHITTADGLELFSQVWAPETAPKATLVLVHGIGDHSGRFQNYVDYFVPRHYRLAGFDLRGHGRSGGRRGHVNRFDQYLADLEQWTTRVRSLSPNTKLFFLGHSLGSLIVLKYGLDHPDELSGVIVTGTALQDALAIPGWLRTAASLFSRVLPALHLNNGVLTTQLSHDPTVIQAYDHDPLVHHWGTPRLATEAEVVRAELYRRAPTWRVPLLMLHGGADSVCLPAGAKAFQARVPAGLVDYREYAGLYHEIHNEPARERVFADIEQWLQAQLGADRNIGG
jgi:acylglycerol lipase